MKRTIFLLLVICFILFPKTIIYSQNSNWNWQNPLPQGNNLNSVKFIGLNTGYAVGNVGTILKTIDRGNNWIIQNSGILNAINSVYFIDENIGYAVSDSGKILKTFDGGNLWKKLANDTIYNLYSVCFTDANTGYAVGGNTNNNISTILKTVNGGLNWITQTSGTINELYSVDFIDSITGYAVGKAGTILKTINAGLNWTLQKSGTTNNLNSVHFTCSDTGFVGGNKTKLKTTDGGNTWVSLPTGSYDELKSVDFLTDSIGYAVSFKCTNCPTGSDYFGIINKTLDGGTSWTSLTLTVNFPLNSVFFTDLSNGCIVGDGGKIFITNDGGSVWTLKSSDDTLVFLNSICYPYSDIGYTAGSFLGYKILKTTDGGNSWNLLKSGLNKNLYSLCFTSQNTGYLTGSDNGLANSSNFILKTTNGGNNWAEHRFLANTGIGSINIKDDRHFGAICFPDDNTGYVVGDFIIKTTDGGNTWKSQSFKNVNLNAITRENTIFTLFAVGDSGAILKSSDDGVTWSVLNSGTTKNLNSIFFSSGSDIFVAGDSGTVLRSTDLGTTWSHINSGTSFNLNCISQNDQDNFYNFFVFGDYGTIRQTTDAGNTWIVHNSGTTKNLNDYNNKVKYAVGDSGIVLRYNNGTWSAKPYVTNNNLNSIFYDSSTEPGLITGDKGTLIRLNANNEPVSLMNPIDTLIDFQYIYLEYSSDFDNGYACGYFRNTGIGAIASTTNQGANWTTNSTGTTNKLNGGFKRNIVGENGVILNNLSAIYSTCSWQYFNAAPWGGGPVNGESFTSVFFTDVNTGYAVGNKNTTTYVGVVYKTTNGGQDWNLQSSFFNKFLLSSFFTDMNNGYIVGEKGLILKTTNAGTNWVVKPSGTTKDLLSVSFSGANNGYIVGESGITLKTIDAGNSWSIEDQMTDNNLHSVCFNGSYNASAVGLYNTIINTLTDFPNSLIENKAKETTYIKLYPNPSNDVITIEFLQNTKESTITIFNINGQELIKERINRSKTQIDISHFSKGVYFVKIVNNDWTMVNKFIKE